MTRGSDVDLDRLADYVGGALDGTPDAADVRQLVDTDPRWAAAHAALVAADAAVRVDLTALGSATPAVPVDVVARLDAALAAASSARTTRTLSLVPPEPSPPIDRTLARLDRTRRRRRWTVAVSAAAAVLVCGVGSVVAIRSGTTIGDTGNKTTSARDAQRPNGAQGAPSAESGGGAAGLAAPAIASGNDYRPETLGQVTAQPRAGAAAPDHTDATNGAFGSSARGGPPELSRLAEPAAQASCLAAIMREYGGTVGLVDFARFEGSPALVVVVDGVRAAAGRRWVVVVGPTCGVGNAINDERYHAAI